MNGCQSTASVGDSLQKVVYRGGELLDPLALKAGDDVVVVEAGGVEPVEQALHVVDVSLEQRLDAAVILEGADRMGSSLAADVCVGRARRLTAGTTRSPLAPSRGSR